MKKILTLSALLVSSFALLACSNTSSSTLTTTQVKPNTIKVGLICIGDSNDQGYTYNFLRDKDTASANLRRKGINVEWVTRFNVNKGEECELNNKELAEEGCKIIINNSFDFEEAMLKVAPKYKDVTFIDCSNSGSSKDNLKNTHNAFASIYEGRYLAGVIAGLKLQNLIENKEIPAESATIGYVGAFPYAEVKSGYSAYYLGARSVCPDAKMIVKFVNAWVDADKEGEAAKALINKGAKIISQHSDSASPSQVAEENKVYHTGYNNDMAMIAPKASLISTRIDWSIYFTHAIETIFKGQELEQDWCQGLKSGAVKMTELNKGIAAPSSEEKLLEVEAKIKNETLHVFDTSTFTVNGEHLEHAYALDTNNDGINDYGEAIKDGYYHESLFQSAPYFNLDIDGITIIE